MRQNEISLNITVSIEHNPKSNSNFFPNILRNRGMDMQKAIGE